MNDKKNEKEEKLEELRKRSKSGYLNQIINDVTPVKSTVKLTPQEEIDDILKSLFED